MTPRRAALLFAPMAFILLVAAAAAWLLRTESGARWLWQRVAHSVPGTLQVDRLRGDLQSGLQLEGLSWADEGTEVAVDTARFTLDLGVWPLAVTVNRLDFGALSIRVAAGTEDAAPLTDVLAGMALPFPLALDRVRGGPLRWYGDAAEADFEVERLSLSVYWFQRLELTDVVAELGDSHWEGRAWLDLQAPFPLQLDVGGRLGAAQTGLARPLPVTAQLRGDLEQAELRVDVDGGDVVLAGKLRQLSGTPGWDMQLLAAHLTWPLDGASDGLAEAAADSGANEPRAPWQVDELEVNSYGGLEDYGIEVTGVVAGPGWPSARLRLVGSGNADGVDARVFELEGEAVAASGPVRLQWRPALSVEATLDVVRADLSPWWAQWGEAALASGSIQAAWSGDRVELAQFDLSAPGTVESLRGSGAIDLEAGRVAADLAWQGFIWPPGAEAPTIVSATGEGRVEGELADWTVDGELELAGPDVPAGRLQLRGGGDEQSLQFEVPRAQALGGTVAGTFGLRWEPTLSWTVDAAVERIATAPLAPEFPGRLSGQLRVQGRESDSRSGTVVDIDIARLAGEVRGREVMARGGLTLAGAKTRARSLQLRSGSSEITLDGHLAETSGLAFTARIEDLADFVDGARGRMAGQGRLAFLQSQPILELDLQGSDLALGEASVGQLRMGAAPEGEAGLLAEVDNVEVGDNRLDKLTLTAGGERPLERLSLQLLFASGQVELGLAGQVVDWSRPLESGWRGRLERLRWDGQRLGYLQLEQPAELSLDAAALTLGTACFRGPRDGQLCLEAGWRDDAQVLDASLREVSANLVLATLDTDLALSQRLTGDIEWRLQRGKRPEARAKLVVSPGAVTLAGEEDDLLQTQQGLLSFEVADGQLYGGNLDIPFVGSGGIDTDFGVPDLSRGLESPLQGRLRFDLESIEPLLHLLPGVEGRSGPLSADISFSGTVGDPQLTGHMSLVRGRISHFATGMLLEDIRLAGAVYQNDETELSGNFRAGEGEGRLQARVDFNDLLRPQVKLALAGDNLRLVNVPDLQISVNPDLQLDWTPEGLGIDGRLAVPSARLSARYAPSTGPTESPDVVVVRGEDPYAAADSASQPARRINGQLQVDLGDDVVILLDRARAQLGGSARFHWRNQLIPTASGGFTLSGEINAYGQSLEVTEGRINFSDRPADNPYLNIRAEREIFGNSQVRRAGVLVTGTLRRPVLETYTVPMTTRERALTMLVTGSDFDYEQGVGSVEVGMYVAPRLYISYGVGLFEDQNVISARYDLGKGFGVKTTSGQRETGADISYTIDR